jgi:hypothetical protein
MEIEKLKLKLKHQIYCRTIKIETITKVRKEGGFRIVTVNEKVKRRSERWETTLVTPCSA